MNDRRDNNININILIKKLFQLKQSVYNMVQICYTVSKTVSTVMVSEEASKNVNCSQFQISVTKYSAIKSNKISSQGVDVLPSEDFAGHNKTDLDVLVSM